MSEKFKRYYIVQFNEKFDEIINISLHKNTKDFGETLDYLKGKISSDLYWELVSEDSDKFIYIDHLYKFKHTCTLKTIYDELSDIHSTIGASLDWIYSEIKDIKDEN